VLIQKAGSHRSHNLLFALRKSLEFVPQIGNGLSPLLSDSVAFERNLDGIQHFLSANWLGQEVDRPRFYGPHGSRDVIFIGCEDDRNVDVCLGKLGLKIKASWFQKLTPSTKQQGLLGSLAVRNFWAEQNNSTSKPADRIKLLSVSREDASSSTTKTTGRVGKSSFFFKAAP
jgi:hypothetical protein